MNTRYKTLESLTIPDLEEHPVWQYVNDDAAGETVIKPVMRLPVRNLIGRVVGTQIKLASGDQVWSLIGNVDVANGRLTEHFLTLTVFRNQLRFTLARYHDIDYAEHGPSALASFLGMNIDDVFPISYDLSRVTEGEPSALIGSILKEPKEKLTRAQIIALAVP
jgi:hypothetical protein